LCLLNWSSQISSMWKLRSYIFFSASPIRLPDADTLIHDPHWLFLKAGWEIIRKDRGRFTGVKSGANLTMRTLSVLRLWYGRKWIWDLELLSDI
jgi:hypothetical protein